VDRRADPDGGDENPSRRTEDEDGSEDEQRGGCTDEKRASLVL